MSEPLQSSPSCIDRVLEIDSEHVRLRFRPMWNGQGNGVQVEIDVFGAETINLFLNGDDVLALAKALKASVPR